MKLLTASAALLTGLIQLANASQMPDYDETRAGLDRVDAISLLGGLYSWADIDSDTIIIWSTPFRPYLVDLSRKSRDLRFATSIAVTSTVGRVYEKFDSVIVDGIRYPIEAIYRLDRETAKNLTRHS